MKALDLPESSFIKTTFCQLQRKCNSERIERTKYGVARVVVNSSRVVHIIYGAIQEICGFEREEWKSARK